MDYSLPDEKFVKVPGIIEIRWTSDDCEYYVVPTDLIEEQGKGLPDTYGKKDKRTTEQAIFWCHLCQCELKSVKTLRLHCRGVQHIRKAMQKEKEFRDKQKLGNKSVPSTSPDTKKPERHDEQKEELQGRPNSSRMSNDRSNQRREGDMRDSDSSNRKRGREDSSNVSGRHQTPRMNESRGDNHGNHGHLMPSRKHENSSYSQRKQEYVEYEDIPKREDKMKQEYEEKSEDLKDPNPDVDTVDKQKKPVQVEDNIMRLHHTVGGIVKKCIGKYYPRAKEFVPGHDKICDAEEFTRIAKELSHKLRKSIKESYEAYNGSLEGINLTGDNVFFIRDEVERHFERIPIIQR